MLILTRRVGETIMIGDDVTVTVLGVKGNQVRIGVDAPAMWPYTVKRSTSASNAKSKTAPPAPAEAGNGEGSFPSFPDPGRYGTCRKSRDFSAPRFTGPRRIGYPSRLSA